MFSLRGIQPSGSRPPLFCFPGGLGSADYFVTLARRLGPNQPVYGLQARGVNGGPRPHDSVAEMAAAYLREIHTIQPRGPYHLLGFCFGALVAFAVAHLIRARGERVALLVSLDGGSPNFDYATYSFEIEEGPHPPWIRRHLAALRSRSPFEILSYLSAKVRRRSGSLGNASATPPLSRDGRCLRRLALPFPRWLGRGYVSFNSDRIAPLYQAAPYAGDMIVFTSRGLFRDPHLGWDGLVTGALEIREIDLTNNRVSSIASEYHAEFSQTIAPHLVALLNLEDDARAG